MEHGINPKPGEFYQYHGKTGIAVNGCSLTNTIKLKTNDCFLVISVQEKPYLIKILFNSSIVNLTMSLNSFVTFCSRRI